MRNLLLFIVLFLAGRLSAQTFVLTNDYTGVFSDIYYAPNGDQYLCRQNGQLLKNGILYRTIPVVNQNEMGLLKFVKYLGRDCVYISRPDSSQKVVCFNVDNSEDVLVSIDYSDLYFSNHKGGSMIAQGDSLFVGVGYGLNGNNSQNMDDYRGKILLITPIGVEIYARGFRNPWRFDIHNDTIYVGDVGDNSWEEIDEVTEAELNFGWPCWEGNHHHQPQDTCGFSQPPVYEYPHSGAPAAITGGVWFNNGFYFCDYETGAGGQLVNGDVTPIQFPLGVVAMAVNPIESRLEVITFAGKIYYLEDIILALPDSISPKVWKHKKKPVPLFYWDGIEPRYVDILGREWENPPRGIVFFDRVEQCLKRIME